MGPRIHVHIYIYIYICICTYIYVYLYIYRICTSCRECEANVYADVHNICLKYRRAHAWCATTPVNACRLCAAYGLVYARLFNCAAASLPRRLLRTCLESCANIVQAVVYCPPYRPPSCRQSVARRVRSRNPSKSTLAHDAVATAVLHKHYPIICVGAGLIQFVYRSHLRLATEATRKQKCIFAIFRASFLRTTCRIDTLLGVVQRMAGLLKLHSITYRRNINMMDCNVKSCNKIEWKIC